MCCPSIRDPSSHARRQVAELDKTAKRSLSKRKSVTESNAKNQKALAQLEEQIASLRSRYGIDIACNGWSSAHCDSMQVDTTLCAHTWKKIRRSAQK